MEIWHANGETILKGMPQQKNSYYNIQKFFSPKLR